MFHVLLNKLKQEVDMVKAKSKAKRRSSKIIDNKGKIRSSARYVLGGKRKRGSTRYVVDK